MVHGIDAAFPIPAGLPRLIGAMLARLLTALRAVMAGAIILLFAYMAVAVLAQVLGRYLFNFSIDWAVESATFAQIWMVLLGAGYAMRKGLHVSVDVVVAKLPAALVRLLNAVISLLCLWFLWVVFEGSLRLIEIGSLQTSSALQIPMRYPYMAIPVATAYLALELVLVLWARSFGLRPADEPEAGMP
jgi:TRAP-type C4-dicarboxylate transport system permease small subunit